MEVLIFSVWTTGLLQVYRVDIAKLKSKKFKMSSEITIYTKSVCPYCTMAKLLLDKKGLSYTLKDAEQSDVFEEMMRKSEGRRTFPQIFIKDKAIGGFDDLNALNQSGDLDKMLASE
jgi:glutaredoxin 3